MITAIVVPCLNEEKHLEATCKSLGFGLGADSAPDDETVLVLVDNVSDDNTLAVMEGVARQSPPGRVYIEIENERGYAPPRHAGALRAGKIAQAHGVSATETLIVQADADTQYAPRYVAKMRNHAEKCGQGVLIEGLAAPSLDFQQNYSGFIALCDKVDESIAQFCVARNEDIVVDDKVAAYRLSDYLSWGGHVREFNQNGDEIFAETTRLFMKAKLMGASKAIANEAVAYPSRRKLFADPALYFATAGFPRERSWIERWRQIRRPTRNIDEFACEFAEKLEQEIELRKLHLLILFSVLPKFIELLWRSGVGVHYTPLEMNLITSTFGTFSRDAAIANPGAAVNKALSTIDEKRTELLQIAAAAD